MKTNRDVRINYLIATAGGAVLGGISVMVLANLIPRMMTQMMRGMMKNMMANMGAEGCSPEKF